jgi:hypothetical protein
VGGAYLDRRFAVFLPLIALFLSDFVIGFHGLMVYVYASVLAIGAIGFWVRRNRALHRMVAGTLAGSILFFLVSKLGVWISGDGAFYPMTLGGLIECYVVALPFFRNSLMGDAFFATVLFGTFEYARRTFGYFEEQPAGDPVH